MKDQNQGVVAGLKEKASRAEGKPAHKRERTILDDLGKNDVQLQPLEKKSNEILTQKGVETKALDSTELRTLADEIITADFFPPILPNLQSLARAVAVLIRINEKLVEQRSRHLTDQKLAVENQAKPLRDEIAKLKVELAAVQKELAAS